MSGSVSKPVQGKTVRLDVYNSERNIFQWFKDSIPAYVPQSDIQVGPNDKGQFSYRFPLGPIVLENAKGTYRVDVTYDGLTKSATFMVR